MKSASGILAGFLGGSVTLAAFVLIADYVGKGAGGICGPTVDLLFAVCILLASAPASITVAIVAYRSSVRYHEQKDLTENRDHEDDAMSN